MIVTINKKNWSRVEQLPPWAVVALLAAFKRRDQPVGLSKSSNSELTITLKEKPCSSLG